VSDPVLALAEGIESSPRAKPLPGWAWIHEVHVQQGFVEETLDMRKKNAGRDLI